MDADHIPPLPSISPAKQDRILIWRSEVASASLEPDTTTNDGASSSRGGGGGSSSATSTTTATSSSSRRVLARGRQVLAKVARRLARRSWRGGAAGADARAEDEGVARTAMYATLSPDYRPSEEERDDDDDGEAAAPCRRTGKEQQGLIQEN